MIRIQEYLHKGLRHVYHPQHIQHIALKDIAFEVRPDLFLAYEWLHTQFPEPHDYCDYIRAPGNRKPFTILEAKTKLQQLYDSMRREYLYLWYPIEFYETEVGYVGMNIHRLSVLLELGYRSIPSVILREGENIDVPKSVILQSYPKRLFRYLEEEQAHRVIERLKEYCANDFQFVENNTTLPS